MRYLRKKLQGGSAYTSRSLSQQSPLWQQRWQLPGPQPLGSPLVEIYYTLFGGSFGVLFVLASAPPNIISGFTEYWFIFQNIPSSSRRFLTNFLFPSEPTYPVRTFGSWMKHVQQESQIAWNPPEGALFPSLSFLASFLLFPYLSALFPIYPKSSDFLCRFQMRISEMLRSRASIGGRGPHGPILALDKVVILVQSHRQYKICR